MCCVCNGSCNHVGNHFYCAAHGGTQVLFQTWSTTSTGFPKPRSFTVTVPGDPGSLNRDRKLHWAAKAEATRQWRTDAYHLALMQRPFETFDRPVLVTAQVFKAKGVMPDPGNSYPACKAIVDGLRDAGVLSNDTGVEITGVLLLAPQRGPDGLEIRIDEVGES